MKLAQAQVWKKDGQFIRIVRLAKGQNITSIADFIAARYGKSQAVAALVATIAVIGVATFDGGDGGINKADDSVVECDHKFDG